MRLRRAVGLVATGALVGVGLVVVPVAPAPASAERGDITRFTDVDGEIDQPTDIAVAPDGIVWFTSQGNDLIGRLDPASGDITTYGADASPGTIDGPNHLTIGADGNVWFTNAGNDLIGRVDVDTGAVDTFADPNHGVHHPGGIASGPDGNVWFTAGRVGRITPAGDITTYGLDSGRLAWGAITPGTDGRMWLVYKEGNNWFFGLASIDVSNRSTTYHDIGQNNTADLVVSSDGDLWYPSLWVFAAGQQIHGVERFDPRTGATTRFDYLNDNGSSTRLAPGPDMSVWLVNGGDQTNHPVLSVGRVNAVTGGIHTWDDPAGGIQTAMDIARGSDGFMWYTNPTLNRISRVDARGSDIAIRKFRDQASVVAGQSIHFQLAVTNTGTTPLTGVATNDPNAPGCSATLPDLAPGVGDTVDCMVTTTFDDRGTYTNIASVDSDQTEAASSNAVSTTVTAAPSISVFLAADELGAVVGETIHYHLTVANHGNVALTDLLVTDSEAPDCARALDDLAVGTGVTVDCEKAAGTGDRGSFGNTATVYSHELAPKSSNRVSVTVGDTRSMSVVLTADEQTVEAGSPIHYGVDVTNTGDVPLERVGITDPDLSNCDHRYLGLIRVGEHDDSTQGCVHVTVPADVPTFATVVVANADRLDPVSSDPISVDVTIPPGGFTDVAPSAFYADAVDWAVLFGVVPGVSDTSFRPSKVVARARLVDALFQMMDHPTGTPRHPFADVPRDAWYRRAVDWAVAQGLVSGARPSFRPDDAVSRADVVKLAWLMVGAPTGNPAHGYTDVPVGARYNAALKWAEANGLLDGFVSGSRFKPDRAVTRGQLVDVLFRLAGTEAAWPQGPGDPPPPSTVVF